MATPTPVVYNVRSGATCYGGRTRPPAPNTVSVHALNRFADILTASNIFTINGVGGQNGGGTPASIFDYTGIEFAPELGAQGSFILTGGGHTGWYGNDILRYDVASKSCSRVTSPWTTLYKSDSVASGNFSDAAGNGELWADSSLTTTLQNQPAAAHMYDHARYLPPGMGGTGSQGGLLTLRRYGTSPNAGQGIRSHIFDFVVGAWARFSTNQIQTDLFGGGDTPYSSGLLDRARQKAYLLDEGWNFRCLDLVTHSWSTMARVTTKPAAAASGMTPVYGTFRHLVALDLYAFFFDKGQGFAIIDPNDLSTWISPASSGAWPNTTGGNAAGGWCWDDTNVRALFYAGDGGKTFYSLVPPSNPKTGTWTISTTTATGSAAPGLNTSGNGHQSRFNWNPATNSAFWVPNATDPITEWKI